MQHCFGSLVEHGSLCFTRVAWGIDWRVIVPPEEKVWSGSVTVAEFVRMFAAMMGGAP